MDFLPTAQREGVLSNDIPERPLRVKEARAKLANENAERDTREAKERRAKLRSEIAIKPDGAPYHLLGLSVEGVEWLMSDEMFRATLLDQTRRRIVRTVLERKSFKAAHGGADYQKAVSDAMLEKHVEVLSKLCVEQDGNGYDLMTAAEAFGSQHKTDQGKHKAIVEVMRDGGHGGTGVNRANRFISWWMDYTIGDLVSALQQAQTEAGDTRCYFYLNVFSMRQPAVHMREMLLCCF